MMHTILRSLILTTSLALLCFGCRSATPATSYYTMRAIDTASATGRSAQNDTPRIIGIRNVVLPSMVNRPQMVRRTGPYEVKVESFHRWAEYPDRMIHQLLQKNLQLLLPEYSVVNAPWQSGFKPDLILSFQFLQLIGSTEKEMELRVVWSLSNEHDDSRRLFRTTGLTKPIRSNGLGDLAQAHSEVLAELSREVAEAIHEIGDSGF